MDDPDAMGVVGKIWVHWVIWNIEPNTKEIKEDSIPTGSIEGKTDFGNTGYGGACPPPGNPHRYIFTVYALKKEKVDANFDAADTTQTQDDFVTSFQTSGFHRTKSELADKGIQRQIAFGGNLSYKFKKLHIGLNGIQYSLKYPLQKSSDPYNLYALSGKSFGNYSIDYCYTYNNLHFFGK